MSGRLGVILVFFLGLACSAFSVANAASLYDEWRTARDARLAELFPRQTRRRSLTPKPALKDMARLLGVSVPRVSIMLTSRNQALNFAQAGVIAAYAGVSREHLLAADLLDRFATVGDLVDALKDESEPVIYFFVRLYARRLDPPGVARTALEHTFAGRRKAEIHNRLALLLPRRGREFTLQQQVAQILGVPRTAATKIVAGATTLTYAQAKQIATATSVEPEYVLAADQLRVLADVGQLERAYAAEPRGARLQALRLYLDDLSRCQTDLESPLSRRANARE